MVKLFKTTGLIMVSGLMLAACSGDPVEKAAQEACDCLKPIYTQLEKVAEAMRSGDQASLSDMSGDMDQSMKAQTCMGDLEKKYPNIRDDTELQSRLTASMDKLCPRPKIFGM